MTTPSVNMDSRDSTCVTPCQDVDLGSLWVETKNTIHNGNQQKLTNKDSFHVYVDEVRFIPDNATVIKVSILQ